MKTNICKFLALFLLVLSSILAGQITLNPGDVVVLAANGAKAATPQKLQVSNVVIPIAANGVYVKQSGTMGSSGMEYWKHETQNYYLYCDDYSLYFYWYLDNNTTDDDDALFYANMPSGTDLNFIKTNYPSPDLVNIVGNSNWVGAPNVGATGTGTAGLTNHVGTATAITIVEYVASVAPTVTTQAVTSIASTTATGNGNITSLGVPNPTAHGVCWNTTGTPTISDSKVDNGAASNTGAFTATITGLNPGTLYYVRAYATNSAQTSYGEQVSFTTNPAMSGVYTVGTGGSFPTLNGTGGLFYKINNSLVTGNITAKIVSNLAETTTTYLSQQTESGAGNYRLRIIPDGTVSRTITGMQSVLIGFNGGDRVTIDGTAAKLLTFDNSNNTSGSGVIPFMIFNSDNDTITNCIIKSVNPASSYVKGISISSSTGTVISKNKIYSLSSGAAADVTAIECYASYATTSINNNMITLTPSTTGKVIGIENTINSVTALNIDYNSIYIGGIQSGSANSYAFGKTGSIVNLRLKDNIFYNARTNLVKVTAAKHYAVYMTNTDGMDDRDYNLLYSASNFIGRMGATDYTTLANWSYLTGDDDHSQSSTLIFEDYSSGDLRFTRATANSAVFDKGTPISGITDDYLGKSRTALFYTQVDIGAYELPQSSGLDDNILPFETSLAQNYPNPFNPTTSISYQLSAMSDVQLSIYNAKGELVKTLVNGLQNAGRYSVNFDGAAFNSGLYFYKLEADGKSMVKRMLLVK